MYPNDIAKDSPFWNYMLFQFFLDTVAVLVTQSCLTLCDPWTVARQALSVHGILQARILKWVAIPFSRGSSQPRDRTQVFCIASRFFTVWATREAFYDTVQFNRSVMSDSLRPHESQHTRPPCPSPTPRVHSYSCLSSQWCHPAISSSVVPFSSFRQSLPASESFHDTMHPQKWIILRMIILFVRNI